MEPLSREELAQFAAQDVAVIAAQLQTNCGWFSSRKLKNLAILASSLLGLSLGEAKYKQEEHNNERDKYLAKIDMLLNGLEQVCKFPERNLPMPSGQMELSVYFPTLTALIAVDLTPDTSSATDAEVIINIKQSIGKFVSQSDAITEPFFNFLRSFSNIERQAKRHAKSTKRDARAQQKPYTEMTKSHEDDTYPRHVYDRLYKILEKHAQCCCMLPGSPSPTLNSHRGRLELKGNIPAIDGEVLFHTVFSKKATMEDFKETKWQHLQFRVPRKQLERRAVGFEGNNGVEEMIDSTKQNYDSVKTPGEFCELLGRDIGAAGMDIRIKNEMMLVLRRAVDIEVDIADERSISLAKVLHDYSLVPKGKLLLAYALAKSVWQFYDSEFMSVRWTTDNIQLFREKEEEDEENDGFSVHWVPYYTFSFGQLAETGSVERLPRHGQFLHRYPRVLALGAILYDIGLPRPRSTANVSGSTTEPPGLEKMINDITARVRKGVERHRSQMRKKRGRSWPDIGLKDIQTLEDYRGIVENCVSEDLFRLDLEHGLQRTPEALEEELTIEERRAILFKRIVEPLKKVVQTSGWVDEFGNILPCHGEGSVTKEDPVSQKLVPVVLLSNDSQTSQITAYGAQDTPEAFRSDGEAWLNKIREGPVMETVVSAFDKGDYTKRRIRIVVLDTGYDPEAIFFEDKDRRRRLKRRSETGWIGNWKDFVDDLPSPVDDHGHGTHVLSVLMKVAPAADVFVARVARNDSELQTSAQNVAKAIEWAWKDCSADIITMSFGFDGEDYVGGEPIVSNSILRAITETKQNILFFAAAANDGGNRDEMFPASNQNVMSIRGSDDKGWACSFNPPPDYNAETCFMTLGRDVPGASLTKSQDKGADVLKSGTSVATPIAAGIAAMLLGYARIYENELQEKLGPRDKTKLGKIRRVTGMTKMFEKMSMEMMDKWSYLNINKFTGRTHDRRLAMIADAVDEAKD
ncbi:hypothetical protein F53441_2727 [Fusarium austroafricanum]|uniref:Peptidase S8/S53 domain-containing protein n=1 Tax=Fusarium austroafricanum TaxID=2364996 RepID=A0A8H4KR84_9HYPO|nr:hypothetical protein F53441_2727 [Fusarium austroafricanum]